jgi:myo-inositol-1-phosphate synthase
MEIVPIKLAVVGVGNCASALIQGLHYYSHADTSISGLLYPVLGGYTSAHISVVAAFDVDIRKVGKDVSEAIFALPNCTTVFYKDVPYLNVAVRQGRTLDSVAEHMSDYPEEQRFLCDETKQASKEEVVAALKQSGAEIVINYLPVGSQKAVEFYAECALEAHCAFINCMPVFIASNPIWAQRFADKNLPLMGDDIKSQLGATILHRAIAILCKKRGIKINNTYQLNMGGNTDFLNMLDRTRLASKKKSKTEAVQSMMKERLPSHNIHIGPSDYVPWLRDNKVAFIRLEGELFGHVPMNIEIRLSVEDSPNSAGVAIDMVRCCKLALNNRLSGIIKVPSAYFCKHPPEQIDDDEAFDALQKYVMQYGQ